MSIIGTGPAVKAGAAIEISAVRAPGSSDTNPVPQPPVTASPATVAASSALDPGAVPIDHARVATIRKAIASHSYPLNPARIGDAMIAAGMMLRMPK